eukprot:COSAG02_NODE_44_length_45948_cov_81.673493_11_plen_162_part_00
MQFLSHFSLPRANPKMQLPCRTVSENTTKFICSMEKTTHDVFSALLASMLATSAEFPAIHRLSSRALNPITLHYTVNTIVYELSTVCLLIKGICHSLVCGKCGGKCHWVTSLPGRNTERSFPPYDTLQMMLAKCVAALAMAEMAAAMVPESLLALQAGGRR